MRFAISVWRACASRPPPGGGGGGGLGPGGGGGLGPGLGGTGGTGHRFHDRSVRRTGLGERTPGHILTGVEEEPLLLATGGTPAILARVFRATESYDRDEIESTVEDPNQPTLL